MQITAYATLVIPFILLVYGAFLLAIHPPRIVIIASLLGGAVIAVINALFDLLAYNLGWWQYNLQGLIFHLPLPLYVTPLVIYGGLVYLLIWRYWRGRGRWFAWLLLAFPLLKMLGDWFYAANGAGYVNWSSPLAPLLDLLMWALAFYAGFALFWRRVPERQSEAAAEQP